MGDLSVLATCLLEACCFTHVTRSSQMAGVAAFEHLGSTRLDVHVCFKHCTLHVCRPERCVVDERGKCLVSNYSIARDRPPRSIKPKTTKELTTRGKFSKYSFGVAVQTALELKRLTAKRVNSITQRMYALFERERETDDNVDQCTYRFNDLIRVVEQEAGCSTDYIPPVSTFTSNVAFLVTHDILCDESDLLPTDVDFEHTRPTTLEALLRQRRSINHGFPPQDTASRARGPVHDSKYVCTTGVPEP